MDQRLPESAITPEPLPGQLDATPPDDAALRRRDAVWARIRSGWWAKILATTVGISVFFVAYFWVLRNPQFELTVMPLSWPDRLIPFDPAALPIYFSLWFYVSLAPALLRDVRELLDFGRACIGLAVVGMAIFLLWPTTTPEFAIDWTQHPSIEFLKRVDVSSNACPSMHVAFAVLTAIRLERTLLELGAPRSLRMGNLVWCIAIAWSTIATRQHVAWDVLAGALLGVAFALLHLHDLRRRSR